MVLIYREDVSEREVLKQIQFFSLERPTKIKVNDWIVYGADTKIREMEEWLSRANFREQAIELINGKILSHKDSTPIMVWFYYRDIICRLNSHITLKNLVNCLVETGLDKDSTLLVSELRESNYVNEYWPGFRGRVNKARRGFYDIVKSCKNSLWRRIYGSVRALIGLVRLIKLYVKRDRYKIIVIKIDNYRKIGNRYGDPMINPVIESLKENGRDFIKISYPHTGVPTMKNLCHYLRDHDCLSFETMYLLAGIPGLGVFIGESLSSENSHSAGTLQREAELFVDDLAEGCSFDGLIDERWIFTAKRMADRFFRIFNPTHLMLTGEYSKGLKAVIAHARELGIKVVVLQHGVIFGKHLGYTFPPGIMSRYKADYFLTHGEVYKNILKDIGYDADIKTLVFGHPRIGELNEIRGCGSERKPERREKVVVITPDYQYRDILRGALVSSVAPHIREFLKENVVCIIKLHPNRERQDGFYNAFIEQYPFKRTDIVDSADVYRLLAEADLHVSFVSTCIQEALCLGTPSIEIVSSPQVYSFTAEFGKYLLPNTVDSVRPNELLERIYRSLSGESPLECKPEMIDKARILFGHPLKYDLISSLISGELE